MGLFDEAVGKRRLAVIYMGNDAKISYQFGFMHTFTLPEIRGLRNYLGFRLNRYIGLEHYRIMLGFRALPRNAQVCIAVEPLWAFFGPLVSYYMPLFQKSLGLSVVQMGLINSANIAAGLVFYILAAPITNKFGRRRTSMLFDFIAWTLAMILWALSRNFTWFLIAAISNAVVRIVLVSWYLLISEDADDSQRSTIFGWINVIGTFGGFTTFVGGLIIARVGIEPAMRGVFWIGSLGMTIMFIARYIGTRETTIGVTLMQKTKKIPLLKLVAAQLPKAGHALKDPFFLKMSGIYFIANAVLSIDFFRVLYLTETKALSPFIVSAVPALSAIAGIFVFFVILPRQKKVGVVSHLGNSFLLCMVAQTAFLLMPKSSPLSALLIFPSLQASYALLSTFRDTVFMNGTDGEHRSERFSLIQGLMLLFSIPMGWFSGLLYTVSPHAPFVLASLLYGIGFLLVRTLYPTEKGHYTQGLKEKA